MIDDGDVRIVQGDAVERLREMANASVHCIVTSPPFYALRDYGTAEWVGGDPDCDHVESWGGKQGTAGSNTLGRDASHPNRATLPETKHAKVPTYYRGTCERCGAESVDHQIGLEATPDEFIASLVEVFRECRRVLRDDGVMWVEIGSSYYAGPTNRFTFTTAEAAYLAGIIDGEGCIQAHRQKREGTADSFQVDVSVAMKDDTVVKWCHEATGIGYLVSREREQWGTHWDWGVRGQQAADLLRTIYPYLRLKRGQAALAIALAEDIVARRGHRVRPVTTEALERRQSLKQAISNLNQRKDAGIVIPEPVPGAPLGVKAKDDLGVPWMLAFALRADGWYLRSDVIWARPNPMPESVTDRPTKAHSYVFLLTKSARYFYDADAIREESQDWSKGGPGEGILTTEHYGAGNGGNAGLADLAGKYRRGEVAPGRNARSVWSIPTQATPFAHFATMPQDLAERCIKAGTSDHGCCATCGAPWERDVEIERVVRTNGGGGGGSRVQEGGRGTSMAETNAYPVRTTIGWKPTCEHCTEIVKCTVLDPFMGSGTTALVARRLGRHAVGIELNPNYIEIAARRLQQLSLLG